MKICAIICEYNPFHNGHLYQLQAAKRLSGADALLCVMSGNFVQRGEAAIIEKFTRAKHAVLAGADAVVELPTVYATSNAELFARGAIHLLAAIPEVTTLCFGAENADKRSFLTSAKLLNDEPAEISEKIKGATAAGLSYAKARAEAWSNILPEGLLTAPNAILGVEYTRAILKENVGIDILPIRRIGNGYKDNVLNGEYASATAIRSAICAQTDLRDKLPEFVKKDLPKALENRLDGLEKLAILQNSPQKLAAVCDCTEGLENAFKKATENSATLVDTLTSTRYTSSRIRRIALQNLLNIKETLIRENLRNQPYLRVLAAKKERKELMTALSKANAKIIVNARDGELLGGIQKDAFNIDLYAEKVYGLLYPTSKNKEIFI